VKATGCPGFTFNVDKALSLIKSKHELEDEDREDEKDAGGVSTSILLVSTTRIN